MSGIATAVVVSAGVGLYSAGRSADAASDAARAAASAEERIAAENRAMLEENVQRARGDLAPWVGQEERAQFRLESDLMTNLRYVPGRDDIQPLGQQGSAYQDFSRYAPGGSGVPQGAPRQTGLTQGRPTPAKVTSEFERDWRRRTLADRQEPLDRWNAIYDREDAGISSGGANRSQTPESERQAMRGQLEGQPDVLARFNAMYDREDGALVGGSPYLQAPEEMQNRAALEAGYRDRTPEYQYEQYVDDERIDPTQYMEDLSSGYSAFIDNPIYQQMIESGLSTAEASSAAQGMSRSGPALLAARDVGQGVSSQFFSNYLNQMGNITGINEARRAREQGYDESRYGAARDISQQRLMGDLSSDEQRFRDARMINEARESDVMGYNEARRRDVQNINEQRFANIINIDEQRRVNEQNTQEQRYSNYMNMLQGMAQPTTTTNLANMSLGVAGNIANMQSQSVAAQNQYNMGAVAAANAARSDVAGGITNLASAYIGSQGYGGGGMPGGYVPTTVNTTTGTISPNYRAMGR